MINSLTLDDIFLIGAIIVIFLIILRLVFGSIKKMIGLIINSCLGAIMLLVVNYFGASFGITVGVNLFTAIIAGVFGIPGVIFLILFEKFM